MAICVTKCSMQQWRARTEAGFSCHACHHCQCFDWACLSSHLQDCQMHVSVLGLL